MPTIASKHNSSERQQHDATSAAKADEQTTRSQQITSEQATRAAHSEQHIDHATYARATEQNGDMTRCICDDLDDPTCDTSDDDDD